MNSHNLPIAPSSTAVPVFNVSHQVFSYVRSLQQVGELNLLPSDSAALCLVPILRLQNAFANTYVTHSENMMNTVSGTAPSWFPFLVPEAVQGSAYISDRERALNAVLSMASLEDDWDGYGAAAIPPDIIRMAYAIISSLQDYVPAPEISPNPNGTISLEWENERGRAHLEIGRTRYSLYFKREGLATLYNDGAVAQIDDSMRNLLDEMFSPIPSRDYTISDIRMAKAA
jgi:hypothetical protein